MRPAGSSGWRRQSARSAKVPARSDPTSSCVRRRGSDHLWDQMPSVGAGDDPGARGARFARYQFSEALERLCYEQDFLGFSQRC
jgi:hypothetical protein